MAILSIINTDVTVTSLNLQCLTIYNIAVSTHVIYSQKVVNRRKKTDQST